MAWAALLVAGLLEVIWVYSMKLSDGFSKIIPSVITVATVLASFYCLSIALRSIPISTAYIVWVGIGAIGAFIIGVTVLGESISLLRTLGLLLVIIGLFMLVRH